MIWHWPRGSRRASACEFNCTMQLETKSRPVVFLVPSDVRSASKTVDRLAEALRSGARLNVISAKPSSLHFSFHEVKVALRVDSKGTPRLAAPAFVGCLAVSSDLPVGRLSPSGERVFAPCPKAALSFNSWANEVMGRIGQLDIPVNYQQSFVRFGVKSTLEQRCATYEQRTGRHVARPRTWIVPPGEVIATQQRLTAEVSKWPVIVKPSNSSRARGIEIISKPEELRSAPETRVVQELVPRPILVDGHKVDVRAHVLLWKGSAFNYAIPSLVLLRAATECYSQGVMASEICNISYTRRLGGRVWATTLAAMVGSQRIWRNVMPSIEETLDSFMNVVAMQAPEQPFFGIWGIDLALTADGGSVQALLLEVNPAPEIYREHKEIDRSMDRMLATEVAPRLKTYLQAL
jgi:hypothetical protein